MIILNLDKQENIVTVPLADSNLGITTINLAPKGGTEVIDPNAQASKTVAPATIRQTVYPDEGYTSINKVYVEAVTAAIDENIQAGNIKAGVEILGVEGIAELVAYSYGEYLPEGDFNTFAAINYDEDDARLAMMSYFDVNRINYNSDADCYAAALDNVATSVQMMTDMTNAGYNLDTDYDGIGSIISSNGYENNTQFVFMPRIGALLYSNTGSSPVWKSAKALVYLPWVGWDPSESWDAGFNQGFTGMTKLARIRGVHMHEEDTRTWAAEQMFNGCSNLRSIGEIDFSRCSTANMIFTGCTKLVDLTDYTFTSVLEAAAQMFDDCHVLCSFPTIDYSNLTTTKWMFRRTGQYSTDEQIAQAVNRTINATINTETCDVQGMFYRFAPGMQLKKDTGVINWTDKMYNLADSPYSINLQMPNCTDANMIGTFYGTGVRELTVYAPLHQGLSEQVMFYCASACDGCTYNCVVTADLGKPTNINSGFRSGLIGDMSNITIDLTNITSSTDAIFAGLEDHSGKNFYQTLPAALDMRNAATLGNICYNWGNYSPTNFPEIRADNATTISMGWSSSRIPLTTMGGFPNMKCDLDVSKAPNLSTDSKIAIIEKALDLTTIGETHTIKFASISDIPEETLALAASKGWTIAA